MEPLKNRTRPLGYAPPQNSGSRMSDAQAPAIETTPTVVTAGAVDVAAVDVDVDVGAVDVGAGGGELLVMCDDV
eukprot:scaffold27518_cov66-Phaeocystis_antarctica.AAC.1